jgi:hypothetical protein
MAVQQLSAEQKMNRMRAHWLRLSADCTKKGQVTPETILVLNELDNPSVPSAILRVWLGVLGDSVAAPTTFPNLKHAILGRVLKCELFRESQSPQSECLEELLDFWRKAVTANRANVVVAVQFAVRLLFPGEARHNLSGPATQDVAFPVTLWGREFGSMEEVCGHFELEVLGPLRERLVSLPVDLQRFEITVG